jgi:predicted Fe-S protein YdhL (DUF1289 family)
MARLCNDGMGVKARFHVSKSQWRSTKAMPPLPYPRQATDFSRRAPRVLELRALPDTPGRAPSTLASPCVRVCCLDDNDMCLGCGRLLSEIRLWGESDDAARARVLDLARARLAQR